MASWLFYPSIYTLAVCSIKLLYTTVGGAQGPSYSQLNLPSASRDPSLCLLCTLHSALYTLHSALCSAKVITKHDAQRCTAEIGMNDSTLTFAAIAAEQDEKTGFVACHDVMERLCICMS